MSAREDLPELVLDDRRDVVALLRELQSAALMHPDAARALFRALVREGRAYAQTPEGAAERRALEGSELVARAELVFQSATMWMMDDADDGALPSAVVQAVAAAAADPDRESLVARLLTSRGMLG